MCMQAHFACLSMSPARKGVTCPLRMFPVPASRIVLRRRESPSCVPSSYATLQDEERKLVMGIVVCAVFRAVLLFAVQCGVYGGCGLSLDPLYVPKAHHFFTTQAKAAKKARKAAEMAEAAAKKANLP